MALQNFVDKVGPVVSAAWLNAVDVLKDTVFGTPTTKEQARAALTSDAPLEVANGGTGSRLGATPYYGVTAEEVAAGVTPTDYGYPSGNVRRYGAAGDGVTNDTTAVAAAIDVASLNANTTEYAGTPVYFPAGTYLVSDEALTYGSSATGLLFYGDGPTSSTIKLAANGTTQVYFYNNSGAQSYRNTFRDLRFLGENASYCNGFKLNDSVGWEKQFKFYNCRFETINTMLTTTGSTNADVCLWVGCEWYTVTTLLNVSNSQSMLHNFVGCRGTVTGDVWVLGVNGGGEFHYIGGSLEHLASGSDKYLVNGSAGPATSVQTGNFTFNNVRFEHRSIYAKLVYWPVADATNRSRQVKITFSKCNLATAIQGAGTTRTGAVLIGEGKTVTFSDCVMPVSATGSNDDFGYTITADDTGAPAVPHPGTIIFKNCSVQLDLFEKITITNVYGVVHAEGNTANESKGTVDLSRQVVNFTKGFANTNVGSLYAQPKLAGMIRRYWPHSDGAGDFDYEYTLKLPAGTILLRAVIYKPAGGADTSTCQYHIGTDNKGTDYCVTGSAAQNALHAQMAQLNIAPFASDTTIRLWMTETTPNTVTEVLTGGYAYIEYI
jgi:hypothetical protein